MVFHPAVVWRTRMEVMRHLLNGKNTALITSRMTKGEEFAHTLVSREIIEVISMSSKTSNNAFVFPLYLTTEEESGQRGLGESARTPNFSASFLRDLSRRLGRPTVTPYGLPRGLTSEEISHFVYAVLHSPGYRNRYAEFLKIDFPRLPLTSSVELFRELARIGGELVALHLVEAAAQHAVSAHYDKVAKAWRYNVAKGQHLPVTLSFNGAEKPAVGRVGWSDDTVWLDTVKSKKSAADAKVTGTVGFRGVHEEVWNFHIGGYQVCEKWLRDRKGRTLTAADIAHYHRIVIALHETIRLMREIDEVIDAHGGWPGAFQGAEAKTEAASVVRFKPRIVQPRPEDRYVTSVPLVPLKAAAGAFSDPQHIEDDNWEWVAVETKHRLRPGMFVAQVVGKSMEPAIPDGSYCLFAAPVTGTRQGKTVLVQLRDATDPETGERYTVKRYESEKTQAGDSWRHAKITLKPVNPDFQPIVLTSADERQLQVVAELAEVLH